MNRSTTTTRHPLTRQHARQMHRDGDTPLSILSALIQSGHEFPDAFSMMVWEFDLDDEEQSELKTAYDQCA